MMTARGVGFGIGGLLVTHNVLRAAAAMMGARERFFNYLRPMRMVGSSSSVNGLILWAIALVGLGLTAWAVRHDWQKARESSGRSLYASALWSALSAAVMGLLMVLVATNVEHMYGWALFVVLPVLMGMEAVVLLGRGRRVSLAESMGAAALSMAILGGILVGVAAEGIICLAMAAPLAIPLALLGGAAGYALQRSPATQHPMTFLLLVGIMPYGATVERALQPPAEIFMTTTSIEFEASPERVWQAVLQPASLAPPSQLLFRAGVAYPRASHIEGTGPSATRYCDFSTGKLVEPVLIWDHLRQLRFRVASNPLPMEEWTPYARIHPPHLDGFLVSRQGEFRLTPLPNGGTHLEASTWYQHHLWPARYWRWWSDSIIHQVHGMVLENIRRRAEQAGPIVN
jgi:hypothetical protein